MSKSLYWKSDFSTASAKPKKNVISYFKNRGVSYPVTKNARYNKATVIYRIRSTKTGKHIGSMYSEISLDPDNDTYLVNRKNHGVSSGGGIYLRGSYKSKIVNVVEGVEDGLSLIKLGVHDAVFATLGTAGMASFSPSDEVESVVIYPDNDGPGRAACVKAIQNLRDRGLYANIVEVPMGKDLNEYLLLKQSGKTKEPLSRGWKNINKSLPVWAELPVKNRVVPVPLNHLMSQPDKEVPYVLMSRLPVGFTLLAGPPKIGKSLLSIELCSAVAAGGKVLGKKVRVSGDVLLLALEDNDQRVKNRFRNITQENPLKSKLRISVISMSNKDPFPELDKGGLDVLETWVKEAKKPVLIVIDVLEKVKPSPKGRSTEYKAAYEALGGLQKFAIENSICVLGITHTRKSSGKEVSPYETIIGSTGLVGVADNVLVLQQSESEYCTLYGRGRDMPEYSRLVKLQKNGKWKDYGRPGMELLSPIQKSCLKAVKIAGRNGASPKEVQENSNVPIESVQKALKTLCVKQFISKKSRGLYVIRRD